MEQTHRSLAEIAAAYGWNGEKYELTEEDYEWLNMKSLGGEI